MELACAWTLMEGFVWTLAFVFAGLWPALLLLSWATERKQGMVAAVLKYIDWGFGFFFYGERPECRMEALIAAFLLWWIIIVLVGLGFCHIFHLLWTMPLAFTFTWNFWQKESHMRFYAHIGSIFVKSAFFLGITAGAFILINWNKI